MTKKHFIELADVIRKPGMMPATIEITLKGALAPGKLSKTETDLAVKRIADGIASDLADFCKTQNAHFDRDRWLGYIAGTNGPGGAPIKAK